MNEEVLRSVLGEVIAIQFAEFENAPEHKFSLHHRLAMKKIFARYNRNVRNIRKTETCGIVRESNRKHRLSLRQRLVIALAIILIACVLCGWVIMFISENISGTVYPDYTKMFAENIEGSPKTIEYQYVLINLPEGFEVVQTESLPYQFCTEYRNSFTNQTIYLCQWVKYKYRPSYSMKKSYIEEVDIGDNIVLYVDLSKANTNRTLVVWDNGDYIIEIVGDLDKDSTLKLCTIDKNESA